MTASSSSPSFHWDGTLRKNNHRPLHAQIIMKCANVRESPRPRKGYAEPRDAQRKILANQLLRGRDDESRMNVVCIGRNASMQRPIRVCGYGYVANRRTKYVWWFGPKGDGMRCHRVVII